MIDVLFVNVRKKAVHWINTFPRLCAGRIFEIILPRDWEDPPFQWANCNLAYFWVATCCINKANYMEYSETINSMFRCYRDAAQCYVYLSDVSVNNIDDD